MLGCNRAWPRLGLARDKKGVTYATRTPWTHPDKKVETGTQTITKAGHKGTLENKMVLHSHSEPKLEKLDQLQ